MNEPQREPSPNIRLVRGNMQHDPNLNPNVTSAGWGFISKLFFAVVGIVCLISLWGCLNSPNSNDAGSAPIKQRRPPVYNPRAGPSAASIAVGDTKRIRAGDPTSRTDISVFKTKEALIRFALAFKRNDTAGMTAAASDAFWLDDYTQVRVIDYVQLGNGLFEILVLQGPQKGRSGWVMDIDLRD